MLCSDQEIRVETFEMRKVDRMGADRLGLCKLLRAATRATACHTLIPTASPHLRPAFNQQDLSFITPHTRLFSCLVAVFLTHPVPVRHPYYPENHRASIPIPRGPDYSILPINIPFSPQICTIYTFNYVQTRCVYLRFTAPITNLTCVIHLLRPSYPPIAPASGLYSYTCTTWYGTYILV